VLDMFLSGQAAWFGVPALIGTAIFAIRMVLMLVGGHAGGLDLDHGGADLHTGGDADAHDAAGAFKALSIQSIMAFAMGFGWAGLGALHGANQSLMISTLIGVGGGVLMCWLLFILLRGVYALQSSGNINLDAAIGREGDVYVTVPAKGQGRGQVRLVLSERQRIYNAESDGEALPSQARCRVVRINEDNSVTVAPA